MGVYGNLWINMSMWGCLWVFMEFRGYMRIRAFLWEPKDMPRAILLVPYL